MTSRNVSVAARGVVVALGGVMTASGLGYLATIVAAGSLGARTFGLYTLAVSTTTALAAMSLMAADRGVLRYVAILRDSGSHAREHEIVQATIGWTLVTSAAMAGILYAAAGILSTLFRDNGALAALLRVAALVIPLMNLLIVLNAVTDARKDMRYRVLTNDLIRNGSFLAYLLVGLMLARLTAAGLTWALVVSYALAVAVALWVTRENLKSARSLVAWRSLTPVLKFSVPFLASQGLNQAGAYVIIFLLGVMGTARDVGMFSAGMALAAGVGLILEAISRIYAPMVAELVERRDMGETEALLRHFTRWSIIWGSPFVAIAILFREPVLALVGEEYVAGGLALAVLVLGHAVNAATGPVGVVLVMSGRAWLNVLDLAVALGLRIALGIWLIGRYGVLGAAIVSTIALALTNVLRVAQVGVVMRVWGYDWGALRPVAAVVPAGILGVLAATRVPTPGAPVQLVLGSVVLLTVYGLGLLLFGLDRQDWEVLQAGFRRVRQFARRPMA